ncbi:hypothetical protein AAC387_Pa12g1647 [Persea americana]
MCSYTRPCVPSSDPLVVWEKFLLPDYPDILTGSVSPVHFSSKKELFICYMLSARKLGIIWGEDPRYWNWTSHPESRFHGVAELLKVCWLHINGKIDAHILSPKTTYKVYLVIKFSEDALGLNHAETSVKLGSHESNKVAFLLEAVPDGVDGEVPQKSWEDAGVHLCTVVRFHGDDGVQPTLDMA